MNPVPHLLNSLFSMASMVEARDPCTGGHLWHVSQFSRLLAEAGKLPATDVARIMLGGFLHDPGKIAVSDAILNQPGRLNELEYGSIQTHPDVGRRLLAEHPLAEHPLAEPASAAISAHHERPACGPIVVLHRRQADGSLVYCRHCGGEVKVSRIGDSISLSFTGKVGDPVALEPDINNELLDERVVAASAALELVSQT